MKSLQDRLDQYAIPEPNSGCLLWFGAANKKGYGHVTIRQNGKKFYKNVAVLVLEAAGKPVPKGMCACHSCDNPPCVEERHLFVGTYKDNIHDMMKKNRYNKAKILATRATKTHCKRGHKFSEYFNTSGYRCKICYREKEDRRNKKRKEAYHEVT